MLGVLSFVALSHAVFAMTAQETSLSTEQHSTTVLDPVTTQNASPTTFSTVPSPPISGSCRARLALVMPAREEGPELRNAWEDERMDEIICLSILAVLGKEMANAPLVLSQLLGDLPPASLPALNLPPASPIDTWDDMPLDLREFWFRGHKPTTKPDLSTVQTYSKLGFATASWTMTRNLQPLIDRTQVTRLPTSTSKVAEHSTMAAEARYLADVSAVLEGVVIASTTLRPGAPAIVAEGKTLSVNSHGDLVIDNSKTLQFAKSAPTPTASVFRIGGETLTGTFVTANDDGSPVLVLGSITLRPGSTTTQGGRTLSLAFNGVLFDGTTPVATLPRTTAATTILIAPNYGTTNTLVTTAKRKKSRGGKLFAPLPKSSRNSIAAFGTRILIMIGWIAVL